MRRFFSIAAAAIAVFGGNVLAAGTALPGKWSVSEIDQKEKIVYAVALPDEPSAVKPEDIEPTLLKALAAAKKKHPDYPRFVIYLAKDKDLSHMFGKLEAEGEEDARVVLGDFGEGAGSKTALVVLGVFLLAAIAAMIFIKRYKRRKIIYGGQ